jgi:TPP-dependent pyruvate/acetoin dehydrogenase alpha subunit
MEDIKNWKARDPIYRLSQSMIHSKIWTEEEESELGKRIDKEIQIAWDKAINDPYPSKDSILEFVYSNN